MMILKWMRKGGFLSALRTLQLRHAERSQGGCVIDCFSGVGGNAIQFAKMYSIFQAAQAITPNIIMLLTWNVDLPQGEELSWLSSSSPLNIEIEESHVQNHLKGITAYFGGTAFGKLDL